jgi:hypothetical protein
MHTSEPFRRSVLQLLLPIKFMGLIVFLTVVGRVDS